MDIRDLLRHIRSNPSDRGVQRETGIDRRTVKQYRAWATAQGLLSGPLPTLEELQLLLKKTLTSTPPPQNVSSVEGYREMVTPLVKEGTEAAAISGPPDRRPGGRAVCMH